MGRNYKKEYADFHGKPEEIENRAARNKARRESGLKKGDSKEAHHIKPLSQGGSNAKGNIRKVESGINRREGGRRGKR